MASATAMPAQLVAKGAQQLAQQLGRETVQRDASACDRQEVQTAQKKTPKPLQIADLDDGVRSSAAGCESRPGRTRTRDKGIMSPLL
jgi:hypothetical protein